MNWLVIVVIAFLVLKVILGYRKGFAKMLLSMVATIATIIIVWIVAPYTTDFLVDHTPLKTSISSGLEQGILTNLENTVGDNTTKLEHLPLPQTIIDQLTNGETGDYYLEMGAQNLAKYVSDYIANLAITAIAYIATFIVVFILIRVIIQVVDLITRIPVLHQLNELMGMALGFLEGMIFIWIGCLVLTMFAGSNWGMEVMKLIQENGFLSWIYNNNFLVQIVLRIVSTLTI